MLINTKTPHPIDYQKISEELIADQMTRHELASVERMEMMARELAAQIQVEKQPRESKNLIHEVNLASKELLDSYLFLTKEIQSKATLTPVTGMME